MQNNWEDLELQVLPLDDNQFSDSESQDFIISSNSQFRISNLELSKKTLKQRTMSQSCDRTFEDFSYRDYDLFEDPFETGHPLFWVTTQQYNPIMYADRYHNSFVYLSDKYELLYFFDQKPDQVILKDPYQFITPASKMMMTKHTQYTQMHLSHEKIKKWITLNGGFRPGRIRSSYQNTVLLNCLEKELNDFLLQYQICGITIFKDWIVFQVDALDYMSQIHFDHYDNLVVLDCGNVPDKILKRLGKILNISEETMMAHGRLEIDELFLFEALLPEFKSKIEFIAAQEGYRLRVYQSQSYSLIKEKILKSVSKYDEQLSESLMNDVDEPCLMMEDQALKKAVSGICYELEGYNVLQSNLRQTGGCVLFKMSEEDSPENFEKLTTNRFLIKENEMWFWESQLEKPRKIELLVNKSWKTFHERLKIEGCRVATNTDLEIISTYTGLPQNEKANIYFNIEKKIEEYKKEIDIKLSDYLNLTKKEQSIVLKDFIHFTVPDFFKKFEIASTQCSVFEDTLCRMAGLTCMPILCCYRIANLENNQIIFSIKSESLEDIQRFVDFFHKAGDKTVYLRGQAFWGFRKKTNDEDDIEVESNQHEVHVDGDILRNIFVELKIKFEEIVKDFPYEMVRYRKESKSFFENMPQNQNNAKLDHRHIVNCPFCSSSDRIKVLETVPYARDKQHFFSQPKNREKTKTVTEFPEKGITITLEFGD